MDMVVRKTINDYCETIRSSLENNPLFIEFQNLAKKHQLVVLISFQEHKFSKNVLQIDVSVHAYDQKGNVYLIPETSEFYDDLGSLGGSDGIMICNCKKSNVKIYDVSDELFDDIKTSIKYLQSMD